MSTKETTKTKKDYLNEEVEMMLHKDDGRYKDDIVVILNGTAIKVPRGKKIKIKQNFSNKYLLVYLSQIFHTIPLLLVMTPKSNDCNISPRKKKEKGKQQTNS